uniref:Uncharacterized protein n=1 Tax=Arundo donax TaxID=35708 RepID=A0A0A9EPP1_ARUDO
MLQGMLHLLECPSKQPTSTLPSPCAHVGLPTDTTVEPMGCQVALALGPHSSQIRHAQ